MSRRVAPATLLADVQRIWPQVAGRAIAAQAEPVAERGGVVTVACASSVWAAELDLLAPGLVERLNGALGAARVRSLRCRAGTGVRAR
ncbi:MAG TPA: DUF721 domain-containing protein [Solirubrobacteraceae bacterium]|nr:DUF721 domain-containing protein [Solirubrobacteraceae bacterium]